MLNLDSDSGDDSDGGDSGGLGALIQAAGTTTPEAQKYSRFILNRDLDNSGSDFGENKVFDQMKANAAQARQALQEARARLLAQHIDPAEAWLTASAALGSPTRTGSFGEGMGALSSAMIGPLREQRQLEAQKNQGVLGIDQALSQVDQGLLGAQFQLANIKRQSQGKMDVEALKTLGKQLGMPLKSMSQYGKIAKDEGLVLGSPEFNARVTQLRNQDLGVKQAEAGMDATTPPPAQQQHAALQYGVPIADVNPLQGLGIKQQQQAREKLQARAQTQLDELEKNAPNEDDTIQKLNRFLYLNKTEPTGKLVGLLPDFSTEAQEMDSISKGLRGALRLPGERVSNYDEKLFMGGTIGRGKTLAANQNLAAAAIQHKQLQKDYRSFLENYVAVNGHTMGADQQWQTYLESNPIFDPSAPGQLKLNPRRMDYKTFFRNKMTGGPDIPSNVLPAPGEQQNPLNNPATRIGAGTVSGYARGGKVEPSFAEGGDVDYGRGLWREALQGALMGYGDEATAGAESLFGDKSYDENLADERGILENFQSHHPYAAYGTQALGALPSMLLGGAGVEAMGARMAPKLAALAARHKIASSLLANAATGAIAGSGAGDENTGRGKTALSGAILGGTLGPLGGLAAKYGIGIAGKTGQRLLSSMPPATSAESAVTQALTRAGGQANLTAAAQSLRKAAASGVPATLADTGGPDTQALATAVAGRATPEARQMASDMATRQAGSRTRVMDQINKALKPDEFFAQDQKLTSDLYANAKPLYEAAYANTPPIPIDQVSDILNTPAGKKAFRIAAIKSQNEMQPLGPPDATGMAQSLNLRSLDYTKRALDDMVSKEEAMGPTDDGRILRGLRNTLKSRIDQLSPDYATARAQYAGDLEVRDALRTGRQDFSKMAPQELSNAVDNMSFAEKDALRSGVAQHLFETLSAPSTNMNAAQRIVGSPETVDKLATLFDKPSEFKVFKAALDREAQMFDTSRQVAQAAQRGRVATGSAGPEGDDLGAQVVSGVQDAATHGVLNSVGGTSLGMKVAHWLASKPTLSNETADQIASILRTGDPKTVDGLVAKFDSQINSAKKLSKVQDTLGGAAGRAVATTAVPSPQGYDLPNEGDQ